MPSMVAENTDLNFVSTLQYLQCLGHWSEEWISVPALRQEILFREWRG